MCIRDRPFVWAALPSWQWWALLCLMGFMGTVGHFILILAYQRAPASTLTPYLYAQIAFAMLGGWLVFSQMPDRYSLIGMALIAVCGAAGAGSRCASAACPSNPPNPDQEIFPSWPSTSKSTPRTRSSGC